MPNFDAIDQADEDAARRADDADTVFASKMSCFI